MVVPMAASLANTLASCRQGSMTLVTEDILVVAWAALSVPLFPFSPTWLGT